MKASNNKKAGKKNMSQLEFEKPILELESKIAELRHVNGDSDLDIESEITRMEEKANRLLTQTYGKLTPAQKVQVARHQDRPHYLDYINGMVDDYTPLAGDRNFADDLALLGGIGRINGQACIIMGHERGHDTESRLKHNFGMARPEGYRKAQRLMKMAERFDLPVVTLVDTAGAYPGMGAEERGQSEAIARSIETCLNIKVPLISVIIGEGGSGGAIAIAAADRIYMLEHSIYSVISPEGCASILWRSGDYASDAAEALKITAQDIHKLGLIDGIIDEPVGGAHRMKKQTIENVAKQVQTALEESASWNKDDIIPARRQKFLKFGRA